MRARGDGQAGREPVTVLLRRMAGGDEEAGKEAYSAVYEQLRAAARGLMRPGGESTLQPTAIVHEAWLKIERGEATDWESRAHFLGVAAKAMRCILVDHARRKRTDKRGAGAQRVPLDDALDAYEERAIDLLALDDALERLASADADLARIVELRFFSGLSIAETAGVMGVSTPTVERGWRTARGFLRVELGAGGGGDA